MGRCKGVNGYQTAQSLPLHTSVTYPIHPILIYISFDTHIVSVCHTFKISNNVNTRLFRHRYFTRRRRCSRPRIRTMSELTRRFVRDVHIWITRRISLTRRIRIWINYYYTSPTLRFLAVLFRGAFRV